MVCNLQPVLYHATKRMNERTRELLVLLVGDIACFYVALWLTLLVRYFDWPTAALWSEHFGPWVTLSLVWVGVFYLAGLYDKHTVFLKSMLFSRIVNTQFVNILVAAILFFVLPFPIAPKTNLIIFLFISIALVSVWRLRVFESLQSKNRERALLIADGPEAEELVREVNGNDRYYYEFVRIINERTAKGIPGFEQKLLALIKRERITIVIANPRGNYLESVLPKLFDLSYLQFQLTFLNFYKVYEDTFDRVPLTALDYDWFIAHVSHAKNFFYTLAKRLMDITLSLVLMVILLVLLPFIYLAIKIEGRQAGVFMTQHRIGAHNAPVQVLKLQTMTSNDAGSGTWTREDAQKGNQVTRVGAVLRAMSIDEFPQVYNILRGEMSLIGPRNDIKGLGERLAAEIPYYNIRNTVKPGVTGWAQTHQHYMGDNISPQSIEESRMRLSYDLYYVKNCSILLDVEIALRTLKTMLSRLGLKIQPRRK
jgi:lipopolysaccharide/colanic/teichoic acid biosynthesis glycosyltransferase